MGLDYQSSVFTCKHRRGEGDNIENTSPCQLPVTLADSKIRNRKETKTQKIYYTRLSYLAKNCLFAFTSCQNSNYWNKGTFQFWFTADPILISVFLAKLTTNRCPAHAYVHCPVTFCHLSNLPFLQKTISSAIPLCL